MFLCCILYFRDFKFSHDFNHSIWADVPQIYVSCLNYCSWSDAYFKSLNISTSHFSGILNLICSNLLTSASALPLIFFPLFTPTSHLFSSPVNFNRVVSLPWFFPVYSHCHCSRSTPSHPWTNLMQKFNCLWPIIAAFSRHSHHCCRNPQFYHAFPIINKLQYFPTAHKDLVLEWER